MAAAMKLHELQKHLKALPDDMPAEDMAIFIDRVRDSVLTGFWVSNTVPGPNLPARRQRARTEVELALQQTIPTCIQTMYWGNIKATAHAHYVANPPVAQSPYFMAFGADVAPEDQYTAEDLVFGYRQQFAGEEFAQGLTRLWNTMPSFTQLVALWGEITAHKIKNQYLADMILLRQRLGDTDAQCVAQITEKFRTGEANRELDNIQHLINSVNGEVARLLKKLQTDQAATIKPIDFLLSRERMQSTYKTGPKIDKGKANMPPNDNNGAPGPYRTQRERRNGSPYRGNKQQDNNGYKGNNRRDQVTPDDVTAAKRNNTWRATNPCMVHRSDSHTNGECKTQQTWDNIKTKKINAAQARVERFCTYCKTNTHNTDKCRHIHDVEAAYKRAQEAKTASINAMRVALPNNGNNNNGNSQDDLIDFSSDNNNSANNSATTNVLMIPPGNISRELWTEYHAITQRIDQVQLNDSNQIQLNDSNKE